MATELGIAIKQAGSWGCCNSCSLKVKEGGCHFVDQNNKDEVSIRQSLMLITDLFMARMALGLNWIQSNDYLNARIYQKIMNNNLCKFLNLKIL